MTGSDSNMLLPVTRNDRHVTATTAAAASSPTPNTTSTTSTLFRKPRTVIWVVAACVVVATLAVVAVGTTWLVSDRSFRSNSSSSRDNTSLQQGSDNTTTINNDHGTLFESRVLRAKPGGGNGNGNSDNCNGAKKTCAPTGSPTTASPTTATPTTVLPTSSPTAPPSDSPTVSPTTESPTTVSPTTTPTTQSPTSKPTASPTDSPTTQGPTSKPTVSPTDSPTTQEPTLSPTTMSPTGAATSSPTGSTPPPENLQQYIDDLVDAGEKYIVVPPATYRLTPVNGRHLYFRDYVDVTLVMANVHLICTETTQAIRIRDSRNVQILGPMTIDYDPLPYTQGRIVAMSADTQVHDIELFEGYPTSDLVSPSASKYEIFYPDTRKLRFGSYFSNQLTQTNGPRNIQITKSSTSHRGGEQVGDLIVVNINYTPTAGYSVPHTVRLENCENVLLQDITLYAAVMFAFFETESSATTYRRCQLIRRPAADDLVVRADPRLRSGNTDAFHSKKATVGPTIEDCTAEFMADDAVNINGDYDMVLGVSPSPNNSQYSILRVLGKSNELHVQTGDPVELWSYLGQRLPNAQAMAAWEDANDNVPTDEEIVFLNQQRMEVNTKNKMRTIFQVEIDRVITTTDLPRGSLIAAANRMGNGFRVSGNTFGEARARGIIIKASNGEVSDNVIRGTHGRGILVAPDYWWMEGGSSNNLQISNNVIQDCLDDGIVVTAKGGEGSLAPAGAHINISITDNTIERVAGDHIWVTSTKGLTLTGNTYDASKLKLEYNSDVVTFRI